MNLNEFQNAANAIRGLAMDAVQKANSGHPGMPMGMADVATVLWKNFLKHNPQNTKWFNRDRFVLSGGHGSMLIYSLLHLAGYDLSLDDLKNFRQWGSKTPGHPEYSDTPGVETTTGPLGQGFANAVGMALAETSLAARFNINNSNIVDHYTYCLVGDGDLQEGISHEAASFAGHHKLNKLIVLYDDNDITIDGATGLSFSEDIEKRFESYGWHVQKVDGHNFEEINKSILAAQSETKKPSIISCKTKIGFGSPNKSGTSDAHGAPLGEDEVKLAKEKLGLPVDKHFFIGPKVLTFMRTQLDDGISANKKWDGIFDQYKKSYPDKALVFEQIMNKDWGSNWKKQFPAFKAGSSVATRKASGAVLNSIAPHIPALMGGSADLTPSNNTLPKGEESFSAENRIGRYIRYGIREHAMGSIMNGMALHGGIIPYSGTFFVFADYMRPAIRMAALMKQQVIYVFTHDSIGLGEDGPTHQPVEHLASLRAMPNLTVIRPADANETVEAWRAALENTNGPTAIVLTRQGLPVLNQEELAPAKNLAYGAYILTEDDNPEIILMASGSEISIALEAKEILNEKGKKVRVVSVPATELFDEQSTTYRKTVLPANLPKVAIEAGASQSWYKYTGSNGTVIGLDRFGASAPYKELYKNLGITSEAVVNAAMEMLP
ncbi:MAG: transketolase [Bacteroidota bacterium]|nr:transketolase [Bacteroidota bacterium]